MSEKRRNLILGLLAIFIVVALIGVIVSNVTDTRDEVEYYDPSEERVERDQEDLIKQMETEFMNSCVAGQATESYCSCVWDSLDSQLTDEELVDLALEAYQTQGQMTEFPPPLENAITECVSEY